MRLLLTILALLASGTMSAAQPPNVIVLLADDAGYGDHTSSGHPAIRTPHLDRIADEGARFGRFYVQPVCAPTRAEFLTGRHHLRGGVYDVSEGGERLALREQTIADVFRAAGYSTACFGKWHNGSQYPYHPNGRGFDEFYGFTSGHWGSYFDAMMDHNGHVVSGQGFMADDLTDHALDFMRAQHAADRPFFATLAFNTPHSPMQVPDAYWDSWDNRTVPADHRYADREDRTHTRAALAMMENLDANVGRVLDELDRLGIADNTIVVYFSDNGPNGHRWNANLKGIKASTDEGGVRSPLFIRWPRAIPTLHHIDTPASVLDLRPTLTALAGLDATPALPLDGLSLDHALTSGLPPPDERLIFAHWRDRVSVRNARYLLDADGELFDLRDDPAQTRPIATEQPAVADRLREAIKAWRSDMRATGATLDPAIIVGHPDAVITPLPARDAALHGGLQRSNKYPNDSYVRHWTSTEDALTWNIEVPVSGRFDVQVYHTAATPGATLELSFRDVRLTGGIPAAWNPPATGAEHDRVPRQESYVKAFRPVSLGIIDLPAAKGTLTLRATQIPGPEALEFRLLTLRRLPAE